MTTTEHPTPEPDGARAAFIAGVRAFAEWLAAHPDVPTPDAMNVTYYAHGVGSGESAALAAELAWTFSGQRKQNGGSRWVTFRPVAGFNCEFTAFVDDRRDSRETW